VRRRTAREIILLCPRCSGGCDRRQYSPSFGPPGGARPGGLAFSSDQLRARIAWWASPQPLPAASQRPPTAFSHAPGAY
jgi:hypothetical protein